MSDPKTMRYPSERTERADTAARSSREPSPKEEPRDPQQAPPADHLHRRGGQDRFRQPGVPRIERAGGPAEGREQERTGSERVHAAVAREVSRRDENEESREADQESRDDRQPRPQPLLDPVEKRHPEGHGRDDERRETGRNAPLRPRHEAVASEQHQPADEDGRPTVASVPARAALPVHPHLEKAR